MADEKPIPPILRELPEDLVGSRVVVRPFRVGDGQALWEAVEESREHLLPWLPWAKGHQTPADSEAYARKKQADWLLREDFSLGIWEQGTVRFLGGSGLHATQWDVPAFEIGYWLRKSAEGHGFMTETVCLVCQLAFDTLKANRVYIRAETLNNRSTAIPRRLGFVEEAVLRNASRSSNGELCDFFLFAMTPAEYAQSPIHNILNAGSPATR